MNPTGSRRAIRFLACVALLPLAAAPPAAAQQCPAVVWADEFAGSAVDPARWSFQLGDGCDIGLCGWGNNELQYYQAANATVGGGTLKVTAKKERVRSREYTSARMRTLNKGEWAFGRFEARIKLTVGKGIWPAFWQMPTDEVYGGWPRSGEIDIMENIGSEPSTVHGTIHFGDPFPNNRSSGASYTLHDGARFNDAFHTFAVEKQPGVIRWLVDDVLYATKTTADVAPSTWPFDERFHFILNVAVGGNWPGSPDATTVFPQTLEVDYVRVYDGYLPYLAGDRVVANRQAGVAYSVGNLPGSANVSWTVPAGAAIVAGQGTPAITVDWGAAGGVVVASVTTACGSKQLAIDVEVEPPYARELSFESFDEPANVTLDGARTTGTLVEVGNPAPGGVNSSALAGQYARNAGQQYDVLFYDVSVINDASQYVTKQKKRIRHHRSGRQGHPAERRHEERRRVVRLLRRRRHALQPDLRSGRERRDLRVVLGFTPSVHATLFLGEARDALPLFLPSSSLRLRFPRRHCGRRRRAERSARRRSRLRLRASRPLRPAAAPGRGRQP